MQEAYKLRDMRVLNLKQYEVRIALGLIFVAQGYNRQHTRDLMHALNFRFSNADFAKWRKIVYKAVCLSETIDYVVDQEYTDRQTQQTQVLAEMRRKGITRDDARNVHGFTFTNDDWTLAGEILTNQNSASQ